MREFFIARARADKPLKFYISFYEIVFHLFHDLYYIIKEWTGNYAGFLLFNLYIAGAINFFILARTFVRIFITHEPFTHLDLFFNRESRM